MNTYLTIDKQDANIEDSSNTLVSNDILQQSELNCLKFMQSENTDTNYQSLKEVESLSPNKIQIKNNPGLINMGSQNQLFVCGLISSIDKIQNIKNKQIHQKENDRQRSNSNIQSKRSKTPRVINRSQEFQQTNQKEFFQLFTTQQPSQYMFKSKDSMSKSMINSILKSDKDVMGFLKTFNGSQSQDKQNIQIFNFNICLNENQGQELQSSKEVKDFILDTQTRNNDSISLKEPSTYRNLDQVANHVVFIFGQRSTKKHKILCVLEEDSLLKQFLNNVEFVKFLKVSLFCMDKEYILTQNCFQSSSQGQREVGMNIRSAMRKKDAVFKKICQSHKQPNQKLLEDLKVTSHLIIQVNHHIFVDLGGIEGLNQTSNRNIVQILTTNYSSVTNQILKLSPYYKNHQFQAGRDQENSTFNMFLQEHISEQSKVLLICSVSPKKEHLNQSLIALDYCQKIKCYFNGMSENDILNHQFNENTSQSQQELSQYFEQINIIKKNVDKAQKSKNNKQSKTNFIQYKNKLETLKLELLNQLQQNFSEQNSENQTNIIQQLIQEIESIQLQIHTQKDQQINISKSRTPIMCNRKSSFSKPTSSSLNRTSLKINESQNKRSTSKTQKKLFTPQTQQFQSKINSKIGQDDSMTNHQESITRQTANPFQTSRDTPQFQQPSHRFQSSIYHNTSEKYQHQSSEESYELSSNGNIQIDMPLQESARTNSDKKSLILLKSQLKEANFENQNLLKIQKYQEQQIQELQQKLLNQTTDKKSFNQVKELQQRLTDQTKIIESLEKQNHLLQQQNEACQSENDNDIQFRLQHLEEKLNKKNLELETLQNEKNEQKQNNQLIIKQISLMKSTIEEFKDREKQYYEVLEKLTKKDKELKHYKKENSQLSQKYEQLKSEFQCLKSQFMSQDQSNEVINKTIKEQIIKLKEQESTIDKLNRDYIKAVENQEEVQNQLKDLQQQFKQEERAKENYKDKVMEIKQELKQAKKQIHDVKQRFIYDDKENMLRQEVKQKQKSLVLTDIKNLIKDYKSDKKSYNMSSSFNKQL